VFVDELLSEEEKALVRDALDVEFILDDKDRERRRREYYEKIFERSLGAVAVQFDMPRADDEYRDIKRQAADALSAPADKRPGDEMFADRLAAVQARFLKRRSDAGLSDK
jgi:hypothetical protein